MNKTLKKITIALSGIILLGISCKKEQPVCKGNCYNIVIKGRVFDKTNLKGLVNIPVEVNWRRGGICIGCTVYTVAKGKTDANGDFNLSQSIDTILFKDYNLSVEIPADTAYFINPLEAGNRFFRKRLYGFTGPELQQLNFELYPKVPLTIKLRRTQTDNFGYFILGHSFIDNFSVSSYSLYNPQLAKDTVLHLQTAPDIYTKIEWRKGINGGPFTEVTDSLICTKGGTNTIEVNF